MKAGGVRVPLRTLASCDPYGEKTKKAKVTVSGFFVSPKVNDSIQKRPRETVKDDLREVLPTSVQKSYFMLSDAERTILNTALEKYRPGQSEPILLGNKVETGVTLDGLVSFED